MAAFIAKNSNLKNILLLLVLAYFFFAFGNGLVSLTDPDEVFYAGTAKEMIQHNSWMTPYLFGQPQFEKPIFLYWMMRISFLIFGITNFAGRLPAAVFGAIGVIAVYLFALLAFKDKKKAFVPSLVLMSAGLYVGLSRTIFTDMIFSVFILLSMLGFFWGYSRKEKKSAGIILFFVFSALATLTKGPLGLLVPSVAICAFLMIRKDLKFLLSRALLWGILAYVLIAFPWYILMIKKYGASFTQEFFYNDHIRRVIEAEHLSNDTWHFYPFSMIWAMFPWSGFVLVSLICLFKNLKKLTQPIYLFLACWIAAVLLIFQPCHSKLVSYIFPMFPALAIVAADFIFEQITKNKTPRLLIFTCRLTALFLGIMCVVLAIGPFAFSRYIAMYLPSKVPFYILFVLFFALVYACLFFLRKGKLLKACMVLAFFMLIILSGIGMVSKHIEPYISSRDMCWYIKDNYKIDNTIVASKFFARGVRFYTGNDIAVMDWGKGYFSPHPIPYLNNDPKFREFLLTQPVTYCVLKKSALQDVKRLPNTFKYEIVKVMGSEYLYKIEKVAN